MRNIYVDPSYAEFEKNKLFELTNPILNRDDQLLPFHRLKESLGALGESVKTADFMLKGDLSSASEYYSLGIIRDYADNVFKSVKMKAFVIMEPPVVAFELYAALPMLTKVFDCVYVHNIHGDGYSLSNVDRARLRKFHWPLPYNDVLSQFWNKNDRHNKIVLINSKHLPRKFPGELYSKRIEAMVALGREGHLDLFGRGWDRWRDKRWLLRPSYWLTRNAVMPIYRGECASKYEVMSDYKFCLCFENMVMLDYMTEKIFDCFYAGTIPIYWGATNISDYVPEEAFIDARLFKSWGDLWKHISEIDDNKLQKMRNAGASFFKTKTASKFFRSLEQIADVPSGDQ